MEFPVYVWVGPVAIHPHWLFESLGYLVGARVYAWLKAGSGDTLAPNDRWTVVAAAFMGAVVGSKVVYWLSDPGMTATHAGDVVYLMAGKSIVGGLAGGLLAVEWIKRRIGVTRRTGDVFAIPLAVGIAIGRIGCFLTGLDDHTYGLPAALPWAVDFGDGISRHPTQLYEGAFLVLLAVALYLMQRRRMLPDGGLFKLFMGAYMLFRLGLEGIKPGVPLAGLVAIQWVCLAVLAWYALEAARARGWRWAGAPRVMHGHG